ncbi:uncharacterized protein METZ01_LOCUS255039, partial [marine metagenome]
MSTTLALPIICGVLSVLYGLFTTRQVLAADAGNERMREIAGAVQEGANAYLSRQYRAIAVVGIVIGAILWALLGA